MAIAALCGGDSRIHAGGDCHEGLRNGVLLRIWHHFLGCAQAGHPRHSPWGMPWRSPQQMPKSHRTQRAFAVHGTSPGRFAMEEHSSAMFAGLVWVRRSSAETHAEDTEGASISTQANYPGELLDSNSAPGQRYWALVYNALKPSNRLAWTPWNQFISERSTWNIWKSKVDDPAPAWNF